MIAHRWLAVLLAVTAASAGASTVAQPDPGAQHRRDPGATRFSPLDQVHRGNVAELRLAWVVELGFTGRVQGAPAVWGDGLFVSTEDGVRAFDAATGAERWEYFEDRNDRTNAGLPRQAPRGGPVVVPDVAGRAIVVVALPSAPVVVALDAADGADAGADGAQEAAAGVDPGEEPGEAGLGAGACLPSSAPSRHSV